MPRVRIEDILLEIDRRCGFTRAFRPLAGYEPRIPDTYRALLATLIAHGTNLGLAAMGPELPRDVTISREWRISEALRGLFQRPWLPRQLLVFVIEPSDGL